MPEENSTSYCQSCQYDEVLEYLRSSVAIGNTYANAEVGKPAGATKDDWPGMDEAAAVRDGSDPTASRPPRKESCILQN